MNQHPAIVRYYATENWADLWRLRFAQLAEQGICLAEDAIPTVPGLPENDIHEWDLNHINKVYCSGRGGFWLAWQRDEPVGYVGGQDLDGVIELRRMYVKASHRRRGIGTLLVQTLMDYCCANNSRAVELWTEKNGLGQSLYTRLGFRQIPMSALGIEEINRATHRSPHPSEIRMQRTL